MADHIVFWDFGPPNGVSFTLIGTLMGTGPHAVRLMFQANRSKEMLDWLQATIDYFKSLPPGTSAVAPEPAPPPQPVQVATQPVGESPQTVVTHPALHPRQVPNYPATDANTKVVPPPHAVIPVRPGDSPMPQMVPIVPAPEVEAAPPVPPQVPVIPPRPPAPTRHTWPETYKIGESVCTNCGTKATGFEKPTCG